MNARAELPMGVVYDMPAEHYHAIHALSAGGLKRMRQSPLHFYAKQLDPLAPHGEPTPAMKAGTLAHCALLEPEKLDERYAIRPDGLDGRTKEGRAWLNSVPAGVEVVTAEQFLTAKRQAAAVRAMLEVQPLLERAQFEVSAFWTDPATGVHCKCRPDVVCEAGDGVVLLDLKTTQDASPDGFPRVVANMAYHLQDAWYVDGYERASGRMVLGFVFICVEAEYPHAAAAYMVDDVSRARAAEENKRLTARYAECLRAGDWPGYPNTIQPISLPAWAF